MIFIWNLGNIIQVIFNQTQYEKIAFGAILISNISAIISVILMLIFISTLFKPKKMLSILNFIAIYLLGGFLALTIQPEIFTVVYNSNIDSFVGSSKSIIWSFYLLIPVIIATSIFIWHLNKQRKLIDKKYQNIALLMIIGSTFVGYITSIVYALRFIFVLQRYTFQLENIFFGIGVLLVSIGLIRGGKIILFGSSDILFINIFNVNGLSYYQGTFKTNFEFDEQLISGITTAFVSFSKVIIGDEVFPQKIEMEDYALLLFKKGDIIGCIGCKYPTEQLFLGLKNIIGNYKPGMEKEKITKSIERFLPYGTPKNIK
ncbi:MAG: hypothetical protein ACFFDW_04140 [Candidatus Thorarchaeota archaeon]